MLCRYLQKSGVNPISKINEQNTTIIFMKYVHKCIGKWLNSSSYHPSPSLPKIFFHLSNILVHVVENTRYNQILTLSCSFMWQFPEKSIEEYSNGTDGLKAHEMWAHIGRVLEG